MTPSQKSRMKQKIKNWSLNSSNCTEIVLWGLNMNSGLGGPLMLAKHITLMYKIPLNVHYYLIGILLSDGWLHIESKNRKINARFGFKQSIKNIESFYNIFVIFSHYCNSLPFLKSNIMRGRTFYSLTLQTRSLPCFTSYYNRFYLNGVKIIPLDIYHDINEISLAMWIEGDGSFMADGSLSLCTDSYSLNEVILLINVLIIKYDLKASLIQRDKTKSQYRIRISKKSMDIVRILVKPYISKSMLYKIHL